MLGRINPGVSHGNLRCLKSETDNSNTVSVMPGGAASGENIVTQLKVAVANPIVHEVSPFDTMIDECVDAIHNMRSIDEPDLAYRNITDARNKVLELISQYRKEHEVKPEQTKALAQIVTLMETTYTYVYCESVAIKETGGARFGGQEITGFVERPEYPYQGIKQKGLNKLRKGMEYITGQAMPEPEPQAKLGLLDRLQQGIQELQNPEPAKHNPSPAQMLVVIQDDILPKLGENKDITRIPEQAESSISPTEVFAHLETVMLPRMRFHEEAGKPAGLLAGVTKKLLSKF